MPSSSAGGVMIGFECDVVKARFGGSWYQVPDMYRETQRSSKIHVHKNQCQCPSQLVQRRRQRARVSFPWVSQAFGNRGRGVSPLILRVLIWWLNV